MKTIEVLSRKQCHLCNGSVYFTSTWTCKCANKTNPAGPGYETVWVSIQERQHD